MIFSVMNGSSPRYWLPKPFCPPQSGQTHVMALQDIPQMFACMHSWQIMKPQRQLQQKGSVFPQQWQIHSRTGRRRRPAAEPLASGFLVMGAMSTFGAGRGAVPGPRRLPMLPGGGIEPPGRPGGNEPSIDSEI
jgi:hypothetical protein